MTYSRWQIEHPAIPERTLLPSISPVESTMNPSACGSGQRNISVSSICTEPQGRNSTQVTFPASTRTRRYTFFPSIETPSVYSPGGTSLTAKCS